MSEPEDRRESEAREAAAERPIGAPASTEGPATTAVAEAPPPRTLEVPAAAIGYDADIEAAAAAARELEIRRELRRLSRRGFVTLAAGAAGAVAGWRWLISRPGENGVPWPFRRTLQANERLWETLWNPSRLAPTYPPSAVAPRARVNGLQGLDRNADPAAWRLAVEGAAAGALALTLADVQALPVRELVTELRCVEGWSMVVRWTGVRLADLVARYPPAGRDGRPADPSRPQELPPFLALETPGRGYYVGLDMQSALHPQTLLAWALDGEPLSWDHGAPLRLVAPMKYGVKNLKRVGTLRYTHVRPGDFWFERGYDWYLGH